MKIGDIIRFEYLNAEFVAEILEVLTTGVVVKVESSPGTLAFLGFIYEGSPLWDRLAEGELIDRHGD